MNTAINKCLDTLMQINGAQAVALVDYESGMLLGEAGSGVDMELAAAGNTEVLRAKMKTAEALNLNDSIEDILISLGKQVFARLSNRHSGLKLLSTKRVPTLIAFNRIDCIRLRANLHTWRKNCNAVGFT